MSDLKIVYYPHPALLRKSRDVTRIDSTLKCWVAQMFDLMYEARGIGLAANQVALPYRLFVINPTGDPEQPEEERVLINPQIIRKNGSEVAEEGCLSLPEVYGQVARAERIKVEAFDLDGQDVSLELSGLDARVVQHENDHLDGILFTQHVSAEERAELDPLLADLSVQFEQAQERGDVGSLEELNANLERLESERTG